MYAQTLGWSDQVGEPGGSCSSHEEITNAYKHSVGKPNGKDYLAELGQDRTVVLKLIFNTRGAGA